LGTLLFTILVLGAFVIVLLILLGTVSGSPSFTGHGAAGLFLVLVGAAIYVWGATAIVREGGGTLSSTAPPLQFIVIGAYRYIRNPIYVGELIVVIGVAAIFGLVLVLTYTSGLFAVLHLFIMGHEEPDLRSRVGSAYEDYVGEVGRWLPFAYLLRRSQDRRACKVRNPIMTTSPLYPEDQVGALHPLSDRT